MSILLYIIKSQANFYIYNILVNWSCVLVTQQSHEHTKVQEAIRWIKVWVVLDIWWAIASFLLVGA